MGTLTTNRKEGWSTLRVTHVSREGLQPDGRVSRGEDCLPSHADYHPNNLTMAKNKTMNCPRCGAWTDIYDSRAPDANVRRRKYVCANMHRFITISEEVFIGFLDEEEKVREQVAKDQHPGDCG